MGRLEEKVAYGGRVERRQSVIPSCWQICVNHFLTMVFRKEDERKKMQRCLFGVSRTKRGLQCLFINYWLVRPLELILLHNSEVLRRILTMRRDWHWWLSVRRASRLWANEGRLVFPVLFYK